MAEIQAQLPKEFYYYLGVVIVMMASQIGLMLGLIFKAGKFVASTEFGIKDSKDCAVRAHKRQDEHVKVYHDE